MPSAVAKSKHPFPGIDSANLLQVLMMPDCVGPAAVTEVVVDDVVLTEVELDTPTQ